MLVYNDKGEGERGGKDRERQGGSGVDEEGTNMREKESERNGMRYKSMESKKIFFKKGREIERKRGYGSERQKMRDGDRQ